MIDARNYSVVLVTAPDMDTARRIAVAALEARLIACANLVPQIESHYWWEGKIESGNEVLMILKTTAALRVELEKLVLSLHPYDTAEFLSVPLDAGTERYLKWLGESCATDAREG
jgi:periplasmic divalent cation tolerance protein